MKKVFLVFLFFNILKIGYSTDIEIKNNELYVNGDVFIIKGVCYNPIPVGKSASYEWELNSDIYTIDFPMIKDMGANCIRTYSVLDYQDVLDSAYKNGIYVIMEYPIPWNTDFTNNTTRTQVLNGVKRMVEKWKSHPAILIWLMGHEVDFNIKLTNNNLKLDKEATNRLKTWYPFLNELAGKIHEWESPYWHPVSYGEGVADVYNFGIYTNTGLSAGAVTIGNPVFYADDANMKNLDIWGVQTYNGKGFTPGYFEKYSTLSSKPLWIAETGCDAYDAKNHVENQDMQSEYISAQWLEIYNNLSARDSSKKCIGVTFFSWNDGWEKSSGSIYTHDTNATWPSAYYYDYVAGKFNMNEEWWGITSIFPGTYEKTPRKAYYTLKNYWNKSNDDDNNSINNILFRKVSVNIPNPFNPDKDANTVINMYLRYNAEIEVKLYNYAGRLIKTFSRNDIKQNAGYNYFIKWDGRDNSNNLVETGLYICRIEARYNIKDSAQVETQYIKIAVVK